MNVRDKIRGELGTLGLFQADSRRLDVVHDGKRILSTLVELNALACSFEQLTVCDPALDGASIDRLKQVGQALSNRLTYLLEPISPIEVDDDHCVVQLRSSPPQKEDDETSYYELLVRKPDEITLCRYAKAYGEARRRVPAHVTREVFLRLVDDFCRAAA